MKIVFLNCWYGRLLGPLKQFIEAQKSTTDVFCFQEAGTATQDALGDVLKMYTKYTALKQAHDPGSEKQGEMHQATYVREGIEVIASHPLLQDGATTGLGLYTHLAVGTKSVHIVNVHGFPWPGKLDTPNRIEQFQEFIDTLEGKEGVRIIGGDFNVLPQTQSIQLYENAGYQNLIQTWKIRTTRNHFAWDAHPTPLYYSDYIFVDENTTVTQLSVPDMEISDHLPLILEILV